jgi:hypothetical protein
MQQQPRVRPQGERSTVYYWMMTCANPAWISPDCRQVSSAQRSWSGWIIITINQS